MITLKSAVVKAVRARLSEPVPQEVLDYLRKNPDDVYEFCLHIQDSYNESDRRTPVLIIGHVLKSLLCEKKGT